MVFLSMVKMADVVVVSGCGGDGRCGGCCVDGGRVVSGCGGDGRCGGCFWIWWRWRMWWLLV